MASSEPTYETWQRMKRRCYDSGFTHYARYGGRGIRVCARWLECFDNFVEDMGFRPGPKYSINRIDNDGNYTPSNCEWATPARQAECRPATKWLFVDGLYRTTRHIFEERGIPPRVVRRRLMLGWTDNDAASIPACGTKCSTQVNNKG